MSPEREARWVEAESLLAELILALRIEREVDARLAEICGTMIPEGGE